MKTGREWKRFLAVFTILVLTFCLVPAGTIRAAKKDPKLSKTTLTFDSPDAKAQTVKIKNLKAKNVKKIIVTNVYEDIIKVKANKKKLKVTVTPKGAGTATSVVICVQFKKPVNNNTEAYLYLENVTVKGGSEPGPEPEPEPAGETTIGTPEELRSIQSYTADKTVYVLTNDIDMRGQEPVKGYGYGCSDFVLDGKGHTIKCDRPVFLINEGTIKNVRFDLSFHAATSDKNDPLTAFWSESYGNNIGPVMTNNADGRLLNCSSSGTIDITFDAPIDQASSGSGGDPIRLAIAKVGGLTGENNCGVIKNCKSTVKIRMDFGGEGSQFAYIGGIVGDNGYNDYLEGGIYESLFDGEITVAGNSGANAGGICGFSSGDITDCLNKGTVKHNNAADSEKGAGIIGKGSSRGKITRCLTTGDVEAGLYGSAVTSGFVDGILPVFTDCYYLNSKSDGFQYLGEAAAVSGTKGISDAELLDETVFTGYDFTGVWKMGADGPGLKELD